MVKDPSMLTKGGMQEQEQQDGPCSGCISLLDDLKTHVRQSHDKHVSLQKTELKTWFVCHYTKNTDEAGVIPAKVSGKVLLWYTVRGSLGKNLFFVPRLYSQSVNDIVLANSC